MIVNDEKFVIGLISKKSGGKETFVKRFQELAESKNFVIDQVTFSDPLGETLGTFHLQKSRENYQELVVALEQKFGPHVLANEIYQRIISKDQAIVIADGMRWPADEQMIREQFPGRSMTVFITATVENRYKWSLERNQKAGEKTTTWEKFCEQENAKAEVSIEDLGARADIILNNTGTLESYNTQIDTLFYEEFLPRLYAAW